MLTLNMKQGLKYRFYRDLKNNNKIQSKTNVNNFEEHITIILSRRSIKIEESENVKSVDTVTLLPYSGDVHRVLVFM